MKYNLINNNFSHFFTFEENKLPARAYFIPFSNRKLLDAQTTLTARYNSDMVKVLNGDWDFKFFKNPNDLPEVFDTDATQFDKIPVPSCWQFQGYDRPFYVNVKYPFPCKPPIIPTNEKMPEYYCPNWDDAYERNVKPVDEYNWIGVYRTFLEIDTLEKEYIISFLGVSSCLDLYVNGKKVGYSEGSHNTAEFDISEFLTLGKNELVATVRRWCNGSYLEDQDMFRNNGIFRDVLLFVNDREFVNDLQFKTTKTAIGYNLDVTVDVKNPENGSIIINFKLNGEEYFSKKPADERVEFSFPDLPVVEWNAEIPTLYDIYVTLEDKCCILQKVGFKTVEYDGEVLRVNKQKIKMKGVNHHDSTPKAGYTMTADEILKDLQIMKQYNVNTVRTSHYPPDPTFIALCGELGLYVVDEADIEAHGVAVYHKPNWISNDLKWQYHFLDRVKRMYMRDRNNVSVTIWSLGNEAGGYRCQDVCYKYLKTVTALPVHYEGVSRCFWRGAYDIRSEMYRSPALMNLNYTKLNKIRKGMKDKPYFLCEYAHAMGVGPGGLEDYWKHFYSNDNFVGGCIWEFVDHAILEADGSYTYGGDHKEYVHDGNFCVDGLFYPDRTPHTGAKEMKVVYRPVRATYIDGKGIEFWNTNFFKSSGYLTILIETLADGKVIKKDKINLDIAPQQKQIYAYNAPKQGDVFINVTYLDGDAEVAKEQLIVNEQMPAFEIDKNAAITVEDTAKFVKITASDCIYCFDKASGNMTNITAFGKEILNQSPLNRWGLKGFSTGLYRVPFDNDRNVISRWKKEGYEKYKFALDSFETSKTDTQITVKVSTTVFADKPMFKVADTYVIFGDGAIKLTSTLTAVAKLGDIPRFGKLVELDKSFGNIAYYGRGEAESYSDFKEQAYVGLYKTAADKEEPYIMPQENGAKSDTRFARVTDKSGVGLLISADDAPFYFTAHRFTPDQHREWKHTPDVKALDTVCLQLDAFMSGVGTNSCGPRPHKNYLLPADKTYTLNLYIRPISKK